MDLIKLYFRSPGHYCFYQKLNATFVSARNNSLVKWQTTSNMASDITKVIGRQCHIKSQAGVRRTKMDLSIGSGIFALRKVWLTHTADAHCTLQGREEVKRGREKLCLKFSCLALKYECYFIAS